MLERQYEYEQRSLADPAKRRVLFIEGLRAWLAWTVVFGHIAVMCGVAAHHGHWGWLPEAGSIAVEIFIVISGFVICNAIIERRERWTTFMVRRGFRILPAYWFVYGLSLMVFPLALELPHALSDPGLEYYNTLHEWAAAMASHPVAEVLLHVVLLQGLVPDSVWPGTVEAVLGQGWSLTLEWQFYLIAPMLVYLLLSPRWRVATVLALFAGMVLFKKGVFGQFPDPAFFPGAGPIFLVGIATRLWLADINRFTVSPVVSICALGFGLMFKDVLWLAVWVALICYFVNREAWLEAGNRAIVKVIEVTLESPIARYLGARSYSVYLLHTAVIQLAIWSVSAVWPSLSRGHLFLAVFAIAPIAILIFSDLLYRCLEHPLTVFGGQLASRMKVREKLATG